MEMSRFEKILVNREAKVRSNAQRVQGHLAEIGTDGLQDALELGCGTGGVSAFLAQEYGMNVVGTDFDPEQVGISKGLRNGPETLRFQVEDAAKLSFEDESFDLVVSQNVFHHIANWREAVPEVSRVLRPGGYLIWFDLAFPKLVALIFRPFLRKSGLYSFGEINSAFAAAGFETKSSKKVFHGPGAHYDLVLQKKA